MRQLWPITVDSRGASVEEKMNRTNEYKEKYDGALDRMWDLFKFSRNIEIDLEKKLELARDELKRIAVIAEGQVGWREGGCYFREIKDIVERGLQDTKT